MLKKEKIINSEPIYDGSVIKVRKDTVITCNDNTAYRDIVWHPGGVGVVAITEDNKVCLVKQYRNPFDDFLVEIPAGKLEGNEDIKKAAERELAEETGYSAEKLEYMGYCLVSPGFCMEKVHLYLATGLKKGECHFDDDEDLELYEYDFKTAYDMVMKGEITDAKSVIGILKAKEICGFSF